MFIYLLLTVRALASISQAGNTNNSYSDAYGNHPTTPRQGLPTPAFLAEVIALTRQLLMENAGECLSVWLFSSEISLFFVSVSPQSQRSLY